MTNLHQKLAEYFPNSEKVWIEHYENDELIPISMFRALVSDGKIIAPDPSLSEVLEVLPKLIDIGTFTDIRLVMCTYTIGGTDFYKFFYKNGNGVMRGYNEIKENPDPTIAALELLLWLKQNKLIGEAG